MCIEFPANLLMSLAKFPFTCFVSSLIIILPATEIITITSMVFSLPYRQHHEDTVIDDDDDEIRSVGRSSRDTKIRRDNAGTSTAVPTNPPQLELYVCLWARVRTLRACPLPPVLYPTVVFLCFF